MDKKTIKILAAASAASVGLIFLFAVSVSYLLKGVTMEGIAEGAGRVAASAEQAYERGKTE